MINKPISILYAEDDEEDRFFFLEAVRSANEYIRIIPVENGQEVIDYLRKLEADQEFPAAIVSDLRMPLRDGLGMLRIVKQELQWKHIPVILFSTSSSHSDIATATQLSAAAFFTKPSTYDELLNVVKDILAICQQYSGTVRSSLP